MDLATVDHLLTTTRSVKKRMDFTRPVEPEIKEVAQILGIPTNVNQSVLLAVAYFKSTAFKPIKRRPVQEVTHWNGWGNGR